MERRHVILATVGFLLIFTGAGTSDMEIAQGTARVFTGIPIAVIGLALMAFAIRRTH